MKTKMSSRHVRRLAFRFVMAVPFSCFFAGSCAAVSLSSDGTGQVLLIPFYTVRDGHVTSVSISNRNQAHTKVVKLRFREGLRGASVLDLNLFLPPRDVWTGAIISNESGASLQSSDSSCTSPRVPTEGIPFNNLHYTGQIPGTQNDQGGDTLDRTREGLVEIIEMGVVANAADDNFSTATQVGNSVARAVQHESLGLPRDCSVVRVAGLFPGQGDLRAPKAGLAASGIIIDSQRGTEFVLPVTALQRFFVPVDPSGDLYTEPGSLKPDLGSVFPARSDIINPDRGEPSVFTVSDWVAAGGQAIDAVSAVLMKPELAGDYDVSDGFQSELVLTFPTLGASIVPPAGTSFVGYVPRSPFSIRQSAPSGHATTANADACTAFQALVSDRDLAPYPRVVTFQPPFPIPSQSKSVAHCRAVARWVVTPFGREADSSTVFGSSGATVPLTLSATGAQGAAPQYRSGWIALAPNMLGSDPSAPGPGLQKTSEQNAITARVILGMTSLSAGGLAQLAPVHSDGIARRYRGLPVIGFSAIRARLSGQGYGGMFPVQGGPGAAP